MWMSSITIFVSVNFPLNYLGIYLLYIFLYYVIWSKNFLVLRSHWRFWSLYWHKMCLFNQFYIFHLIFLWIISIQYLINFLLDLFCFPLLQKKSYEYILIFYPIFFLVSFLTNIFFLITGKFIIYYSFCLFMTFLLLWFSYHFIFFSF